MYIKALKEFRTLHNDFQAGQIADVADDQAKLAIAEGNAVASSFDQWLATLEAKSESPAVERAVASPMKRVSK